MENVTVGAERPRHRWEGGAAGLERLALAALDFVGLGGRADEMVTSFSYGHQRLIEIARALASNPTVLLLDEPAAGLNSSEKKSLHELLERIAAQGLTILIIDHDMTLVAGVARHLTVLNFGRRIAPSLTTPLEEAVKAGYLTALARPPTAEELADSVAFVKDQTESYRADHKEDARELALADFCQVLMCLNEFVYVD